MLVWGTSSSHAGRNHAEVWWVNIRGLEQMLNPLSIMKLVINVAPHSSFCIG